MIELVPSPTHPASCLSTSVQYHSWCSPGYSTSLPHQVKSSSSSCLVGSSQLNPGSRLAHLQLWTDGSPSEGREDSAVAAAAVCHLWTRKEPRGLLGSKRRQCGEESGFLRGLHHVARCAGSPPL